MSNLLISQTLTISSTGETGTSGTGWSISGTSLTVSANANIRASVIQTAMASSNLTIVASVISPYNLNVTIDESLNANNLLTIGASANTGIITINQPITVFSGVTIYCNTLNLHANITCTNQSGANVRIYCINPLINVTSPRTISTTSIFGIYAPSTSFFPTGFTEDLVYPIQNLTTTQTFLELGNAYNNSSANRNIKNVIISGDITNNNYISINGKKIILNGNLKSTFGEIRFLANEGLEITSNRSITAATNFTLQPQSTSPASFTTGFENFVFPIPNLTVTSNGLGSSSDNGIITISDNLNYTTGSVSLKGASININGNISTTSGSISLNGFNTLSPININGNIKTTLATTTSLGNISCKGSATVAARKFIECAGIFTQDGNITFKSDATGTAAFGTLGGTYTRTSGTVTVERYIPAKRAFRFLSPAVTTTTSIMANWQESAGTTAGLGTHITGGASNGFDATVSNSPSMFTFTNGAWAPVTSTLGVLTAGTPYRLMVRGDRTISLATNGPGATATTLRATGALKTGNFTPTLNPTADGFSLIGNPYQAPIDIKAVLAASTNMNSGFVYYWDPTLNERGAYVTRELGTVNQNSPSSNFDQYVQPGQAVFVKKDNTANVPTMTITEANKSVAFASAGVFRTANTSNYGLLRVNLQANNANQWQTIEGTLAVFNDSFSWNVTSEDATKMNNLDEEVSFVQNNTSLAIATQNNPSATSELPIKIDKMRHTNYQWQFELTNYDGPTPYLYDTLNNSYTQISNGTVFPFTADLSTTNRFKIVFQNSILSIDDFASHIVLYPNPAKADTGFYLQGISEASVAVYNLLGQSIPVQTKSQGNSLQVSPKTILNKGVYLVNIAADGKTKQIKWIVE